MLFPQSSVLWNPVIYVLTNNAVRNTLWLYFYKQYIIITSQGNFYSHSPLNSKRWHVVFDYSRMIQNEILDGGTSSSIISFWINLD